MDIRSADAEFPRIYTLWIQNKKPARIDFLGKTWLAITDNAETFFLATAGGDLDERYNQNSMP